MAHKCFDKETSAKLKISQIINQLTNYANQLLKIDKRKIQPLLIDNICSADLAGKQTKLKLNKI